MKEIPSSCLQLLLLLVQIQYVLVVFFPLQPPGLAIVRIICSPVIFADFHSEIISLGYILVMTCSVYLHSLGSVAQNSYRGKHGWMDDLDSQVFEAFCGVMHHNKQMIVEPAWCLPSTVLISLLLCCFVCLVYLDL